MLDWAYPHWPDDDGDELLHCPHYTPSKEDKSIRVCSSPNLSAAITRGVKDEEEIDRLKAEVKDLAKKFVDMDVYAKEKEAEVERLREKKEYAIHGDWLEAPREKLIECLRWVGAIDKEQEAIIADLRKRVQELEGELFIAKTNMRVALKTLEMVKGGASVSHRLDNTINTVEGSIKRIPEDFYQSYKAVKEAE